MSGKNNRKLRQIVRSASGDIYDEIKKQVNALQLRDRLKIAARIIRGRW